MRPPLRSGPITELFITTTGDSAPVPRIGTLTLGEVLLGAET